MYRVQLMDMNTGEIWLTAEVSCYDSAWTTAKANIEKLFYERGVELDVRITKIHY